MGTPTFQRQACAVVGYVVIESLWLEHEKRITEIAPFIRLDELVDPDTARHIEADPALGDVLRLVGHWAMMLEHDESEEEIGAFFRVQTDRLRCLFFDLAQTTVAGKPVFPPEWLPLRGHL